LLKVLVLSVILAECSATALAGVETVEIAKVQVVKAVSGVVRDSSGAPIRGETVSDVSPDGKLVARTTVTDENGKFAFALEPAKKTYNLMISMNSFNPLLVHVRISRWTKRSLVLRLQLST
jgi:hypothetical protein